MPQSGNSFRNVPAWRCLSQATASEMFRPGDVSILQLFMNYSGLTTSQSGNCFGELPAQVNVPFTVIMPLVTVTVIVS
jgi:hypothetical protein